MTNSDGGIDFAAIRFHLPVDIPVGTCVAILGLCAAGRGGIIGFAVGFYPVYNPTSNYPFACHLACGWILRRQILRVKRRRPP